MKVKATKWGWLLAMGLVLSWLLGGTGQAADLMDRMKNQEITQVLRLRVGQSKVLRTPFAITRISVADPEIADIILISDKEIYVNAQAPGVTNLSIWGKTRFSTAKVMVEADVSLLKEKLYQILPKEKIGVEAAGDSVVLSGEVSGPVAQETAISLAISFVGKKDKVVNLMHVGGVQQVMLEVRMAEINRTVLDRIGINFSGLTPTGNFGVQQINSLAPITGLIRTFAGTLWTQGLSTNLTALGGWKAGGILWTAFFDVLKQQNLGRMLAEPNLVTTSGQEASFLAGGEFPIPVPQSGVGGGTTITIEYKQFGVGLKFTPTVLNEGKIGMRVNPEVSEIDPTTSITTIAGYQVPGLRVRRMTTHIEIKDGQTFAIAGLIADNHRTIVNKFPVLGDIPVLGALFRSNSYQTQETELVALVTPYLVKPLAPGAARLPTDVWIEPNDFEKYLLGWSQGRGPQDQAALPPEPQPLPPGFGRQSVK